MSSGSNTLTLESLKRKYINFSRELPETIKTGLLPQYKRLAFFLNLLIKQYFTVFPLGETTINNEEDLRWWDAFITSVKSNLSQLIKTVQDDCFTTRNLEIIKNCLSDKVQEYISSCAPLNNTPPANFLEHNYTNGVVNKAYFIQPSLKQFQDNIISSVQSVQPDVVQPTPLGQVAFTALLLLLFL